MSILLHSFLHVGRHFIPFGLCVLNFNFIFWFAPHSIPESIEVHLETNLQSGRNSWKNSRRPSQPDIRSLNYPFEDIVRELLVQSQVGKFSILTPPQRHPNRIQFLRLMIYAEDNGEGIICIPNHPLVPF